MCFRALAAIALIGCVVPQPPRRCEVSPGGCQDVPLDEFAVTARCDGEGPLTVQIGDGERSFDPVDDFADIGRISGRQGGQHMFVGVRVGGLELDKYDEVHVEISLWRGCLEADCWVSEDALVLGREEPLEVVADDAVQAVGLFVFYDGESRLRVVATDPCGRRGEAVVD